MRLALESNFERNIHNLRLALTQEFLGTIDALTEYELMRSQIGAALEQFGKVRLAHLGQSGQFANLEWLIQIPSDSFDNARQSNRRYSEDILTCEVAGIYKGLGQLPSQFVRNNLRLHDQQVHIVVLHAALS